MKAKSTYQMMIVDPTSKEDWINLTSALGLGHDIYWHEQFYGLVYFILAIEGKNEG